MILLINLYQRLISPLLHDFLNLATGTRPACRFSPSCSEYAKSCYQRYSFIKATLMTFRRLSQCHPFATGVHA